jgi:hypothetical protein
MKEDVKLYLPLGGWIISFTHRKKIIFSSLDKKLRDCKHASQYSRSTTGKLNKFSLHGRYSRMEDGYLSKESIYLLLQRCM